jgi:hypothetical protein
MPLYIFFSSSVNAAHANYSFRFCFGAEDFSWSLNASPGQLILALNLSAATGNLFV